MGRNHRNVEFINQLKQISGHRSLTAFAKAAGLSPQNASSYLGGSKVPKDKALSKILVHLYGGKHPNVVFFNLLRQLSGFRTLTAFAKSCGLSPQNAASYLSGTKTPKSKVLSNALANLYGWPVKRLVEIAPLPENLSQLPNKPGLYVLYDSGLNVLYIGKATHFDYEVRQTLHRRVPIQLRKSPSLKKHKPQIGDLATMYSLYQIDHPETRHRFESLLLRIISNQTHNTNIGHF